MPGGLGGLVPRSPARKSCEKNQVRLRPMDSGEAQYLEIKASIYGNARKASISKSGPMPTAHTPAPASRAVLS